jgi:hypothetical protein
MVLVWALVMERQWAPALAPVMELLLGSVSDLVSGLEMELE